MTTTNGKLAKGTATANPRKSKIGTVKLGESVTSDDKVNVGVAGEELKER